MLEDDWRRLEYRNNPFIDTSNSLDKNTYVNDLLPASEIVKNLKASFEDNLRQIRQGDHDTEAALALLESGYGWVLSRCIKSLEEAELEIVNERKKIIK